MRTRSSGDLIAGKYRLERPLARGGMGEVWTARNLQLDVPVAIKLMNAQALSSPELVERFEREAKAAAQLRHPNVVTIFEYGVFDGVPFMAMELLDGQDLSARLKERGRLPHAEALAVISGVCKALRRAHEMLIVHRDLKPANVFLARQDDEEMVKVLDFGIAKLIGGAAGAQSTKAGSLLGTPHYMAPEQAQDTGIKIDHRADMWALGVIAFRMLTGKLPFTAPDPVKVLVRICTERPPAASSMAPDLGPDVDAFFTRALARHPAERFQSARDFVEAFAALGGRPRVDPLAQSGMSAPHSEGPLPRPALGSAPSVLDGAMGRAATGPAPWSSPAASPPVRPSSPGMPAVRPATSPQSVDDVQDSAQTLPIQASPRAQAARASLGSPHTRALTGTLPLNTPVAAVLDNASPALPSVASARARGLLGAVPLDVPSAAIPDNPSPSPAAFTSPSSAASPPAPRGNAWANDSAAMPTLATSVDAGTITRASTEAGPRPVASGGRNTAIVVVALFAALLVIGVVGWTVISAADPDSAAEPPPIRLPTAAPTALPTLAPAPADTPTAAPSGVATASEVATASSSSSEPPAPSAPAPSSSPVTNSAAPTPRPTGSGKPPVKARAPGPGNQPPASKDDLSTPKF